MIGLGVPAPGEHIIVIVRFPSIKYHFRESKCDANTKLTGTKLDLFLVKMAIG